MQRLRFPAVATVLVVLLALLLSPSNATYALQTSSSARTLMLAERVQCQQAIEQVYWDYRIWSPENTTPKPTLETMLTPDMVLARVEDTARQSNLLATHWHTPVTGTMVQAEMERMANESRQPEQLRALMSALGNNPTLVAECLARPALVERLVREWYAQDDRLHGDLAGRATADLARISDPSDLPTTTGEYQETTWRLADNAIADPSGAMVLDESEWASQRDTLAGWFGTSLEAIPTAQISPLHEDETGYFAVAVLSQSETTMNIATVRWQKEPFEEWWAQEKARFSTTIDPLDYAYTLPPVKGTPEAQSMGDSSWLPTPSLPVRTNVTAVWTGSEMIVFGGGSLGTGRSNDGWRYNPATDTWLTIVSINAPMERFGHTAIWSGTEMIVWGGCGPFQYAFCELSSGGRYNPVTGVWTATSGTNAPAARLAHTAVWTGSEMIVWGGCAPNTNGSNCVEKNTGGRYNPATDTWIATSLTNVPSERVGHTAVWTGDEMIIWGGEDGLTALNTGGRYDPDTDTWAATNTATAPSARAIHTAVWTGTEMIIWGGCPALAGCIVQGTPVNTGGRYNPTTDSWTATSTTNVPSARAAHTAVWTGTEMIVWGGGTSTNILFNTGGRYSPATDSWTATNTTNAPSARFGHVAVWTGDLMLVWGGSSRTGGRYSPASDSWTPTSDEDPNSIRSNHVAVWTGVEMIVWGGDDVPNGTVDTGRIYTPATRTWRDTPPSSLGGRHSLAAVWTGTEMIVWGGQVGNFIYDTGGRFNPTTNTWTPMTTTNAPEARAWHVAVWTGSEMIIWGGNGETAYMNTGGRYNPSTNTWTATSLTNAPSGRYLHAGVWDGDELIIWGGLESVGDTSTGARYNPNTNSWQATSLPNAPSARHFHSATWTGEKMIIWGGVTDLSNPTNFNTGGQYDPDSDSWQATSTTNAPAGRVRHTAIWTGAEMIVWGGCPGLYCGSNPFYDGGHYDPIADIWTPTAIDNGIPRARGEHTAVWTGDRMIVWGGYTDLSSFTNTGAEYFTDAPPPPPTPTPSATVVPPTATATGEPPTTTPTATGVPSTPTATPTTFPGTITPTPTGVPPTVTPSATGVPGTPTATAVPATPTSTTTPQNYRVFLPLIEG